MFEAFDIIRVINLRSRRDRRNQMLAQLQSVGLADDARVAFFDAIRPVDKGPFSSVGAHGVYLSHKAILQEAVDRSASVLILEDDCDISESALQLDIGRGWDVFYGGYLASDPSDLDNSDIIGAHMMGFSAEGAKSMLDYLNGLCLSAQHPPIDGAYVWFRRDNPKSIALFAVPPVGFQRPSRSDIEPGKIFNRVPVLREVVGLVRSIIYRARGSKRVELKNIKW